MELDRHANKAFKVAHRAPADGSFQVLHDLSGCSQEQTQCIEFHKVTHHAREFEITSGAQMLLTNSSQGHAPNTALKEISRRPKDTVTDTVEFGCVPFC